MDVALNFLGAAIGGLLFVWVVGGICIITEPGGEYPPAWLAISILGGAWLVGAVVGFFVSHRLSST